MGEEGMLIYSGDTNNNEILTDSISALNTSPRDVAGAGDSLLISGALTMTAGGSIWEAAMLAAGQHVHQLTAIVDYNKWQATGRSQEVMALEPLAAKWEAFGWHAQEIDGHDLPAINQALEAARAETNKPSVIVAHTIKGKGVWWGKDSGGKRLVVVVGLGGRGLLNRHEQVARLERVAHRDADAAHLCGNQISGAPRHRRDVVSVAASARWRGGSTPSTRRCPRDRVGSMAWRLTKVHAIFLRIT